jgi:hypothetical protein
MGGDPTGHKARDDRQPVVPQPAKLDAPVPGRDGKVGGTTIEGAAAQELRTAIGALNQLETMWLPALEAAAKAKHAPDPMMVINTRSTLRRAEDALAHAGSVRAAVHAADVEALFKTAIAKHDVIAPRVRAALDDDHHTGANAGPSPGPSLADNPAIAQHVHAVVPAGVQPTPVLTAGGYEPTWEDIAAAARGDKDALAKLDTDWIDGLHANIIEGIDGQFRHAAVNARFAAAVAKDAGIKQLADDNKKAQAKVISDEQDARKAADPKADRSAKTLAKDPAILAKQHELDEAYKQKRATAEATLRATFDQDKHKATRTGGINENVAEPPKDGVTNAEGRLLARANFVGWGIHVLGSAARLKKHYQTMKHVSKLSDPKWPLLMEAGAADRLTAAANDFEQKYPGNRFFDTSVGFGLRNAHNEKHHLSYLGHALGWSVDFQAVANPSFLNHPGKDGGIGGSVGRFMLKKFGGGPVNMKMPSDAYVEIRKMGEARARGEEPSERGKAILDATKSYDEMTATSERFRASQTANMTELAAAKQAWVEVNGPKKVALKAANAKLAAVQKAAAKKAAADPSVKAAADKDAAKAAIADLVAKDQDVIDATAAVKKVQDEIAAKNVVINAAMAKAFGPWVKQLEDEIAAFQSPVSDADKALAASDKPLTAAMDKIKDLATREALIKILDDKKYAPYFDVAALKLIQDAAALKAAMLTRLETLRSKNPTWNEGEIKIRKALITKLQSGHGVFGDVIQKDGHWKVEAEVNAPPVMQLLEIGFARHDELADPSKEPARLKNPKKVFNREFIQTMMRHGFAPLNMHEAFIDTMHFDFLEGHASTPKGDFSAGGDLGPKSKG